VQQWRSRLLTALGSNGQIIIDVIPEVELIIGKQPYRKLSNPSTESLQFNLSKVCAGVLFKGTSPGDLLDDLQWSDSATPS